MFIALLVILLSMSTVSAQNLQCDPMKMQTEMMTCAQNQPNIMQLISEFQSKPQATMDNLCNHQPIVVDILDCATKIGISCLPKEEKLLSDFVPAKENWKNGLEFVCKHKAEPIGTCLKNISDGMPSMPICMMTNVGAFAAAQNTTDPKDKKQMFCRALDIKPCLQSFKDLCPERTLSIISQSIEKFIPMETCKDSSNAASVLSFSIMGCFGLGLIAMGLFYPLF